MTLGDSLDLSEHVSSSAAQRLGHRGRWVLVFERGLVLGPWLAWNWLCSLGWPQTCRDPPASASTISSIVSVDSGHGPPFSVTGMSSSQNWDYVSFAVVPVPRILLIQVSTEEAPTECTDMAYPVPYNLNPTPDTS